MKFKVRVELIRPNGMPGRDKIWPWAKATEHPYYWFYHQSTNPRTHRPLADQHHLYFLSSHGRLPNTGNTLRSGSYFFEELP